MASISEVEAQAEVYWSLYVHSNYLGLDHTGRTEFFRACEEGKIDLAKS
jgi:hypothetical protein